MAKKPPVFKPTLPPLIVVIVDSTLMIVGTVVPDWLLGVLLGAAITWLVVSVVSVRPRIVARWPKSRMWFPFLDTTGGFAVAAELKGNHIEGLTFRISDVAVDGYVVGKTFDNCTIHGPAVIACEQFTVARHAHWVVKHEGGFWYQLDLRPNGGGIPKDGLIHLVNCTMNNCSYVNIGIAGPKREEFMGMFDKTIPPSKEPSGKDDLSMQASASIAEK